MSDMRRRQFITLLGSGAAAWLLAARAQQGERMRRTGVLTAFSDSDALAENWLAAFRKRLDELAWRDGRNVQIDYRWAAGDADQLRHVRSLHLGFATYSRLPAG